MLSDLSAAGHVGLCARTERQPEGEPDRERHAGSDSQSGHLTGGWHRFLHRTVCFSFVKSDFTRE